MILVDCGNYSDLAKKLAGKLNIKYSKLKISNFPDGDIYLKYNQDYCLYNNY